MDYSPETKNPDLPKARDRLDAPRKFAPVDDNDAAEATNKESTISRKKLTNKLNHLHFTNRHLRIQFHNPDNNHVISINAMPQPCFGKHVVCMWQNQDNQPKLSGAYRFRQLEIITDEQVVSAPCRIRAMSDKGICLTLPDKATQHTCRKTPRYTCKPLQINLIQSGMIFSGILKDFSKSSFRVALYSTGETPVQWINREHPVNAVIMTGETPVYSGECMVMKQNGHLRRNDMVLELSKKPIQRFAPREYRSKRIILTPSPDIHFYHPITGGPVHLKVLDVSGSGLAVEDDEESSILIPGLIIPDLTVNFANSFSFSCQAQVLYRQSFTDKNQKPLVRCGIAFLDVAPADHIKLLSLLHNAENQNVYICSHVDVDKLWAFFFDTGFIYPKKYAFLRGCTEQVKNTYKTLYSEQSSISRHFTWQKKGEILAHLAMLQFYERSWLIHHLAARTSKHIGAGIEILNQVGDFVLEAHRLISNHMDYLLCYFRPEMRFSDHFFGNIARNIQNPKACSIDSFAYIRFRAKKTEPLLPSPWTLQKPDFTDLNIFKEFYTQISGGLMLNALDMMPDEDMKERKSLAYRYQEHGLNRERRIYVLKKNDIIKAVIMANISDIALNLSDLTNCISLFIVDKEDLKPDIAYKALSITAKHYVRRQFPVLIYPIDYVHGHGISYNRIYQLWALNMDYTDEYFKQYKKLF